MIGWSARARLRRRSRAAGITTHPCSIRVAQSDRTTQMKALPACLPTSFLTQALGVRTSHVRSPRTKANMSSSHSGRTVSIQESDSSQLSDRQSVSYFTVPPRVHPSTGSQSGSSQESVICEQDTSEATVRGWGTCMGTCKFSRSHPALTPPPALNPAPPLPFNHKYRVLAPGGYSIVASEVCLSQRTGGSQLSLFALVYR